MSQEPTGIPAWPPRPHAPGGATAPQGPQGPTVDGWTRLRGVSCSPVPFGDSTSPGSAGRRPRSDSIVSVTDPSRAAAPGHQAQK